MNNCIPFLDLLCMFMLHRADEATWTTHDIVQNVVECSFFLSSSENCDASVSLCDI